MPCRELEADGARHIACSRQRAQLGVGELGSSSAAGGTGEPNFRIDRDLIYLSRLYISSEARHQTKMGPSALTGAAHAARILTAPTMRRRAIAVTARPCAISWAVAASDCAASTSRSALARVLASSAASAAAAAAAVAAAAASAAASVRDGAAAAALGALGAGAEGAHSAQRAAASARKAACNASVRARLQAKRSLACNKNSHSRDVQP